jgi:hypothetical protein
MSTIDNAARKGWTMSDAPAFTRWLDDFFTSYYRRNPVSATFIGVHDHDALLPDLSPAADAAAAAELDDLLRRLDSLPAEPLAAPEQLDRELARAALEIQRWELGAAQFQAGNPCVYTGEAIFGCISLVLRDFAPLPERMAALEARLRAVPALLAQGRGRLRRAPADWIARARRECAGAQAFLGDGIDWLRAQHGLAGGLRAAADGAAQAFVEFDTFLQRGLTPTADGYAAGEAAIELQIRRAHFLEQGADAIAADARAVIAECQAALDAGAAQFGARDWREALAGLAAIHPSVGDYYSRYTELWEACRATASEQNLLSWPDYPLRYVPQPVWARAAAPQLYFLFYRAPAAFDQVPVVEYLVTPIEPDMPADEQLRRLRATNESVIKLNHVVHHGAIGHHVQNWHAYRAPSRIGRVAAVDCASRIALPCGGTMAEGWACYATDLMDEAGFLTPLERYSQHHARLRMAARALVDVELHRGRLTLDQAAALYADAAGMAPEAARAEAVKNSMFPGAALIYLSGTDQIHALRRTLAAREGAAFSLRRFHDRFLSYGSIPVALIARAMLAA